MTKDEKVEWQVRPAVSNLCSVPETELAPIAI